MKRILKEMVRVESAVADSVTEYPPLVSLKGASVNFHLWHPCNMRCNFCFATFMDVKATVLPKGHLPQEEAMAVVRLLGAAGVGKLTFAGGEPLLCPWLPALIREAKRLGMTTMIVTNGSRLTDEWLMQVDDCLDWVTLSVDSLHATTNAASGRREKGKAAPDFGDYLECGNRVLTFGIRLKLNTVVSRSNKHEDLGSLIRALKPERWKVLQALPVTGQNSAHAGEFEVKAWEFEGFLARHANLKDITNIVPEPVDAITGSYLMIDPAGRFYDDVQGWHRYSRPVLEVGLETALGDVVFDQAKFVERGGKYAY